MRKVRWTHIERLAGLFIVGCFGSLFIFSATVAVKQGWFERKLHYWAVFQNAEGIHPGTLVKIAGLTVGSVENVEILNQNQVRIDFLVQAKFEKQVRDDSIAQLLRPYLIGDRVLDVSIGREDALVKLQNTQVNSDESFDLLTLLSGKKLGTYFENMGEVFSNLRVLALALTEKDRMKTIIRVFDHMEPLLANLNELSKQATHKKALQRTLAQLPILSEQINEIISVMIESNPEFGRDLSVLASRLNTVSGELVNVKNEVGITETARKMADALVEITTVMKAMQKSFLLRGSVRELHEEESRKPATK